MKYSRLVVFAGIAAIADASVYLYATGRLPMFNPGDAGVPAGQRQARGNFADRPVPVVTATAAAKDVPVQIRTIGAIEALTKVAVKSRVDGQSLKTFFKDGQHVKKNAIMMIDFALARQRSQGVTSLEAIRRRRMTVAGPIRATGSARRRPP